MLHLFFEENRLCPGFCEIFLNMEDSTSAHLTFKKRSWLCENAMGVFHRIFIENGNVISEKVVQLWSYFPQ